MEYFSVPVEEKTRHIFMGYLVLCSYFISCTHFSSAFKLSLTFPALLSQTLRWRVVVWSKSLTVTCLLSDEWHVGEPASLSPSGKKISRSSPSPPLHCPTHLHSLLPYVVPHPRHGTRSDCDWQAEQRHQMRRRLSRIGGIELIDSIWVSIVSLQICDVTKK
jgi:hypothetical protein